MLNISSEWTPEERLKVIHAISDKLDNQLRAKTATLADCFYANDVIYQVSYMPSTYLELNRLGIMKQAGVE